ncbi:hypothetical protein CIB84_017198, partial [Bambusicola thoracicus]
MIAMVISKVRERLLALDATEPVTIYVPFDFRHWEFAFRRSDHIQCALAGFTGQLSVHPPPHKMLQSLPSLPLVLQPKLSPTPLPSALTVFTDGSGKTGRAVAVWKGLSGDWEQDVFVTTGSAQILELTAVVRVFERWSESLNVVTDSAYV